MRIGNDGRKCEEEEENGIREPETNERKRRRQRERDGSI